MTDNLLMIAASEIDANLFYASRFLAPDSFIYLKLHGRSYLLLSDLERDRARLQSCVDEVIGLSDLREKAKTQGIERPTEIDVLYLFLSEQGVFELRVPGNFPIESADALRAKGIVLSVREEPFFAERAIKTEVEVRAIRKTQVAIEAAMDEAVRMLRASDIHHGELYYEEVPLTSEAVRRVLHRVLMEQNCTAQHTIVAGGMDACDPHQEGSGTLRAHEAIVFDIFPRSLETRYFADMSRTVVRGKAPDPIKRLYETVLEGQVLGISRVCNGASASAIHEEIVALFESRGYTTGQVNGRMQGFFHGTGHGVGIDIHEPPRIGKGNGTLKTGEVVTIEPGLYYPGIGGVRIEDMVLVLEQGCQNLTTYPKFLEID